MIRHCRTKTEGSIIFPSHYPPLTMEQMGWLWNSSQQKNQNSTDGEGTEERVISLRFSGLLKVQHKQKGVSPPCHSNTYVCVLVHFNETGAMATAVIFKPLVTFLVSFCLVSSPPARDSATYSHICLSFSCLTSSCRAPRTNLGSVSNHSRLNLPRNLHWPIFYSL